MQLWGNNGVCVVAARRRSTAAASVLLPQPYLQHDVHHARPAAAARHHVSTARRLAAPTSTHFYWYKTLIGRRVQVLENTSVSTSCEHFLCFGFIPSNSWEQTFSNHLAPWLYFFSKFYMILLSFILKNSPYFPLEVCKLLSVLFYFHNFNTSLPNHFYATIKLRDFHEIAFHSTEKAV